MKDLEFGWSESKNAANRRKHGVSLEEAVTVFLDGEALVIPDPDHSLEEGRFIILGISNELRLLVVVHTYNEPEARIRIISARRAHPSERSDYGAR